jgi:hypothetical protein
MIIQRALSESVGLYQADALNRRLFAFGDVRINPFFLPDSKVLLEGRDNPRA